MRKAYVWLFVIFAVSLGVRLYFAFSSPFLTTDSAYFALRQVEHIQQTGLPLFEDSLSFGGNTFMFGPVWYYLLALFGFIFGNVFALKLFPNIFASLICVTGFFLAYTITRSRRAAIVGSVLVAFVPLYFWSTIDTASVYALVIPLGLFMVWCFLQVHKDNFLWWFIVSFIVLSFTHASVIIFLGGLFVYLALSRLDNITKKKMEVETLVFGLFFSLWAQLITYKVALQVYGPLVVVQNIPFGVREKILPAIGVLDGMYQIGVVASVVGVYSISKYTLRERKREVLPLVGISVVSFLLLWLQLGNWAFIGLFLGVSLALLASQYVVDVMLFMKNMRGQLWKSVASVSIVLVIIASSLLPSLGHADELSGEGIRGEDVSALLWLNNHTRVGSVVLGGVREGNSIAALGGRKTVIDNNFLGRNDGVTRVEDIDVIMHTQFETTAVELLNKYNIRYIYFSHGLRDEFGVDKLLFMKNSACFRIVYDKMDIIIIEVLCEYQVK